MPPESSAIRLIPAPDPAQADPVEALRNRVDAGGPSAVDPFRLIRQPELFERMAVSEATGARLKSRGAIGPRPIRVGGCLRYYLPEVLAWLQHRRPDGSLHDARTWPPVWDALQAKRGR